MSLEIIFGKNKSGKTRYLEGKYKNDNPNVLFIPSEINFDSVLKGNLGTPAKEILPPHKKFLNFFNKIIGRNHLVILDDVRYNDLVESKRFFDSLFDQIRNDDDEFFEECFKYSLDTKDLYVNTFNLEFDLLKFNSSKRKDFNVSSGSLSYSLIKMLYKIILESEIILNENMQTKRFETNGFTLIIDELEKFLHPELIVKLAHMLVKISEKIDVIVTTHSPIFLERIFFIHKNILKNRIDHDIKYSLMAREWKKPKINPIKETNRRKLTRNKDNWLNWGNPINETNQNGIIVNTNKLTANKNEIEKILLDQNYRTLSNLSNLWFSSKSFLVEGLLDTSIINNIIQDDSELRDKHYTIIDCGSRGDVEKLYNLMCSITFSETQMIDLYKICLFYDSDNKNPITTNNNCYEIVNHPNLEQRFFNLDNIENGNINNPTKCIEIKSGWATSKSFKRECINLINSSKENNHYFCFTTDWIKDNSTKDKQQLIDNEINDLKKEIREFLLNY